MNKNFFDKYGNKISQGDILLFDTGSIYKVIDKDGVLCLKCYSRELPLFELNKVATRGVLISACQKNI